MSNRKTLDQKIESTLEEIKQKEAQYKELLKKQKEADRKARNHRLCERGGKVEKRLPRLAILNDEQFETWMKKTLLSGFAEKILNEILPPEPAAADGVDAAAQPADTAAHTEAAPAPKPAQTAQNDGGNANARPAQTTAQQGGGNIHGKPADAGRVAS